MQLKKDNLINIIFGFIISAAIIIGLSIYFFSRNESLVKEDIRVGLLYSRKGPLAMSEKPVINAILLAIQQINAKGGIEGHKIIPILPQEDVAAWRSPAQIAEKMIRQHHVVAIFGCWTSACRKAVKVVVEKEENLLIYPTQYEGVEESSNIIYLGATPNQQIIPAVKWSLDHFGKRVYIIGSDYIFPHVANEIIKAQVKAMGGEVVGISYIPLDSMQVETAVNDIIRTQPDVIFNTINGDTNIAFFEKLHELSAPHKKIPVMSFSLSDAILYKIPLPAVIGSYAAWSYFKTAEYEENKKFLEDYRRAYGSDADVNDPAVAAYAAVFIFARAVRQTLNDLSSLNIRQYMLRQSIDSPAGVIYIDPKNAHAWRKVLIGRVDQDHTFNVIWTSYHPIQPIVYPPFKTKEQWDFFEYQLFLKWNQSWERPS